MSEVNKEILKKLADKFDPQDLEWRVQQAGIGGGGKPWAMVIPYITNRAIQQRLDDVVGAGNWKDEYKSSPCNTGYLCGISIKVNEEWVTKWDGSVFEGNGGIDAVKSTCSTSEKRTGVKWGIGRYLYQLEVTFANCTIVDNRSATPAGWNFQQSPKSAKVAYKMAWQNPTPPDWALPNEDSKQYIEALKGANSIDELRHYWKQFYNLAKSLNNLSLMEQGELIKGELKAKFESQDLEKQERQLTDFNAWLEGRVSLAMDIENESGRKQFIKAIEWDIPSKCIELGQSKVAATEKLNELTKG